MKTMEVISALLTVSSAGDSGDLREELFVFALLPLLASITGAILAVVTHRVIDVWRERRYRKRRAERTRRLRAQR